MKLENNNYYELLELDTAASQEEVHESYLRSKNAYSGESVALYSLLTEKECAQILEQIEQAYSVLSDPQKRREYDKVKNIKNTVTHISAASNIALEKSGAGKGMDAGRPEYDSRDFTINQNEVDISRVAAANRFRLTYEVNPEMEQEIESATVFDGEFLKKIREYKNVSVDRMCDLTKISRSYIRHLESNDLANLPALAYVRGFIYQYAKCLKLMPDLVATSYLNQLKAKGRPQK